MKTKAKVGTEKKQQTKGNKMSKRKTNRRTKLVKSITRGHRRTAAAKRMQTQQSTTSRTAQEAKVSHMCIHQIDSRIAEWTGHICWED